MTTEECEEKYIESDQLPNWSLLSIISHYSKCDEHTFVASVRCALVGEYLLY